MNRLLLPLFLLLIVTSCNCDDKKMKDDTTNSIIQADNQTEYKFIHTVFFWLTDKVTDEERMEFEKGLTRLGEVKTIGKYFMGVPADTDRDVIDSSYDYAWIVHFKNGSDQDSYQTDPIHLEFIENYRHLWEKVQVYDTNLIEPFEEN